MPVYTETKTYHTKAHMGMIDVTDDFRAAVQLSLIHISEPTRRS